MIKHAGTALLILAFWVGLSFFLVNKPQDTTIESENGAVVVGKVHSETLTYRLKVVDQKDIDNDIDAGFANLGTLRPNEFMVPAMTAALGDDFSYDAMLVGPTAILINTYVMYKGDKGIAEKLIDKRSFVFHTNTTVKEILAEVALHTEAVAREYKTKHSYLTK